MKWTGSDVMFAGSLILVLIVLWIPHNLIFWIAIPFMIVEVSIAYYIVYKNSKLEKRLTK